MFWTENEVHSFAISHPISTGGAATPYQIGISEVKDDGDQWIELILPLWSNNSNVQRGVITFAQAALDRGEVTLLAVVNAIHIHCHLHWCDPD